MTIHDDITLVRSGVRDLQSYTGEGAPELTEHEGKAFERVLAAAGSEPGWIPDRDAFITEFVIELTRCQRAYASVHEDDKTDWSAKELGSLAHDVFTQMTEEV